MPLRMDHSSVGCGGCVCIFLHGEILRKPEAERAVFNESRDNTGDVFSHHCLADFFTKIILTYDLDTQQHSFYTKYSSLSVSSLVTFNMPVTIKPAENKRRIIRPRLQAKTSLDYLYNACRKESRQCRELLQSSFDLEPQVRRVGNIFSERVP